MKLEIKKKIKRMGFKGEVVFASSIDFGKISLAKSFNQRLIDPSYDLEHAVEVANKDLFQVIIIYLEPPSYYENIKKIETRNTVWTENEIVALRKSIGFCGRYSVAAVDHILSMMGDGFEAKITPDQTEKGINYLKNLVFKKDGNIRTAKTNFLFNMDREINILKKFKSFKWVGVHCEYGWQNRIRQSAPIYRVISKSGEFFDYIAGSFGECKMY